MRKFFLLAATVCTILSSCSEGSEPSIEPTPEPTPTPQEQVKIPINLSIGNYTRANDTAFENGDKVGIYVVNYNGSTAGTLATSGNHVNNTQFTYNGSAWTPASTIYWLDQTTHADFYAYYPYSASASISAHSFSVKTDQSTEANYFASDFLWGKATNIAPIKNAVPITTNHTFSNILIYLEAGEGFTAETFAAATKSVKITNIKTSATINLATGVATATGDIAAITPWNVGTHYRAMVVPQTVADGTNLITITIDGVDYTFAKGFTFKPNHQHKFTVSINKTNGNIDIGIGGWESDDSDNGGSANDELENPSDSGNENQWGN